MVNKRGSFFGKALTVLVIVMTLVLISSIIIRIEPRFSATILVIIWIVGVVLGILALLWERT